jgi:hypothetical protein
MDSPPPLPAGARPFCVTVDPDLDALRIYENWDAWQQALIAEMQVEGITITYMDGLNTFCGYYYPEHATPHYWLLES